MYSWEIEQLMKQKQYLLKVKEYLEILNTSPQINRVSYHKESDDFYLATDDRYEFTFKLEKRKEENYERKNC